MSLSYCLYKFVIISAVSVSKPTYRFTAVEQGRKIMSSAGGAKGGEFFYVRCSSHTCFTLHEK